MTGPCPPHSAVLDTEGQLVCAVCKIKLSRTCLACIVAHDGFAASHVCRVGYARGLRVAALWGLLRRMNDRDWAVYVAYRAEGKPT